MQTIIMMAEVGGNCFWHPKNDYSAEWKLWLPTGATIDIEELPLSWELNNQLTEWIEFYEENYPNILKDKNSNMLVSFDVLGKHLWQLVQEELNKDYKVVYYSELAQEVIE